MGREVRLIRALADEGFQYGPNEGKPPIPRDQMTRFASLPKHLAHRLMDEIEATGIPVMMLRGDGQINPDGVRDYDLLVPATVEAHVIDAPRPTRARLLAEADAWRASFATTDGVRALLQRASEASVTRRRRGRRRRSARGWSILVGCRARRRCGASPTRWRAGSPSCASSGTTRAGRTARCIDVRGQALVVSQFTLFADTRRGRRPGFTGAAPPEQAERLYERFAAALREHDVHVATGRFGAEMAVELVNDGPFTIWLDSADR